MYDKYNQHMLSDTLLVDAFAKALPPGTIHFISGSGRATMPPLMKLEPLMPWDSLEVPRLLTNLSNSILIHTDSNFSCNWKRKTWRYVLLLNQ
jgi:hypothetical protein